MSTIYITSGRSTLIIGEHNDKVFIKTLPDGGFYTADQAWEAAGELMAIARRIRRKKG